MDKEQNPKSPEAPETPELQETLENEEINTDAVKSEETAEEPVEGDAITAAEKIIEDNPEEIAPNGDAAEELKEAKAEPEGTLFDIPEEKKDKRMLIIVIILSVVAVLGLVIGILAVLNSGKGDQSSDQTNTSSTKDEDAEKRKNELKEKTEKELKEKEEKEKKEKEEKEKKEKEEKEKAEKEKKEQEEKEKQAKEALKTTLDADGVLNKVAETINDAIRVDGSTFEVSKGNWTIYQPAEYKAHVYLGGKDLSATSSENLAAKGYTSSEVQSSVNSQLLDLGFEKIESVENPFLFISNLAIFYNSSTNVVCTSYSSFEPILGCSTSTNYNLSEKAIINNLAEAYNKVEGHYPLVVASPDPDHEAVVSAVIKDTGYKQYQTITPFIGHNAMSIFYRESPNSEWAYLLSTQAAIDCSIYSTELQKGLGAYCQNQ